jgi:hypothetical protein
MTTLGPFESVTVNISTHITTEIKALRNEVDVTLGVIIMNLARVVEVADGFAEFVAGNTKTLDCVLRQVEAGVSDMPSLSDAPPASLDAPLTPLTPPVPPVDVAVTHTLMMRQYDEMRRVMASEQEKTRVYMKNWAVMMAVLVFLMTIIVVSHVHVIVYMLKEPVVFESSAPVCNPYFDCIAKFLTREIAKTTRDEWAH